VALSGKVCVVTGASRGIGRACAEALASAGARVAACASRSAPDLPGAFSRRCDVSNRSEVTRFFAEIERQVGNVATLIDSALEEPSARNRADAHHVSAGRHPIGFELAALVGAGCVWSLVLYHTDGDPTSSAGVGLWLALVLSGMYVVLGLFLTTTRRRRERGRTGSGSRPG